MVIISFYMYLTNICSKIIMLLYSLVNFISLFYLFSLDDIYNYTQTGLQTDCKSIQIRARRQEEDVSLAQSLLPHTFDEICYKPRIIRSIRNNLNVMHSFYVTRTTIIFTIIFK